MVNFHTTKNKYRRKIKRFFEIERCTYKINANKKEYVWFIYRPMLSNEISGLYLYNITERKEEIDKLLVNDMLKILYGYMCLYNNTFIKTICGISDSLKKSSGIFKESIVEEQKHRLQEIKSSIPGFVYEELVKVTALFSLISEEEQSLIGFTEKYVGVVKEIKTGKEAVQSKLLLTFFEDIYNYNVSLKNLQKYIEEEKQLLKKVEDYFLAITDKGAFPAYDTIVNSQVNCNINFDFYDECPLVKNAILKDFSEMIIDPYKKLVRNAV